MASEEHAVPSETKRKRGGQPNNLNALKHGFYSTQFKAGEINDLEAAAEVGLESEISMLRVISRRVFEYANLNEPEDVEKWSQLLSSLGMAAIRISNLLRQQKLLGANGGDVAEALSQALRQVTNDLKLS